MNEPLKLKFSWPYPRGIEYKHVFENAEFESAIPPGLLSRVGWQESRFREDIIKGVKRSAAGALGIMQIVPKWHPNVDPLDPVASIRYAAKFLAQLHKLFGSWQLALAAYNWGPGNLQNCPPNGAWPVETHNYVFEILSDAYELLAARAD